MITLKHCYNFIYNEVKMNDKAHNRFIKKGIVLTEASSFLITPEI